MYGRGKTKKVDYYLNLYQRVVTYFYKEDKKVLTYEETNWHGNE